MTARARRTLGPAHARRATPSLQSAAAKRGAPPPDGLPLWAARLGFAVFVIGGWQLFTTMEGRRPVLLRPAVRHLEAHGRPVHSTGTEFGSFWVDIETTLEGGGLRLRARYASPESCSGLLLGQNRFLADVLGPYIKIVNAIPRIVLGSIFIVAFGIGITPKVLLAAVLVFFVVFFNAFQGVREVDRNIWSPTSESWAPHRCRSSATSPCPRR